MSRDKASNENEEKLYTIQEAQIELEKKACTLYGHDYEILEDPQTGNPIQIVCARCERDWIVPL